MEQNKRLLLTIVLCMAVLVVWQMLFPPPKPPPLEVPDGGELALGDGGEADAARAAAGADAGAAVASSVVPLAPTAPEKLVDVATPSQELSFSSRGAGLKRAVVKTAGAWKEYKFHARVRGGGASDGVDMVRVREGDPLPGDATLAGELELKPGAPFEAESLPDGVTFRTATADLALEKRFTVGSNGYELGLEVRLTNQTDRPRKAMLTIHFPAWIDPKTEQSGSFFSPPPEQAQVMCRHAGSSDRAAHKKDEEVAQGWPGPVQFAGFDERYFAGLVFPRFAAGTACRLAVAANGLRDGMVDADLGILKPGETVAREFGLYVGPKALGELTRVSQANAQGSPRTPVGAAPAAGPGARVDPELTHAIDFGMWAVICRVLLEVMKFFQRGVVNWGIAIILLTVLVKLALYPLTKKSMESMEAMRRLQPQLEALRKKNEGDKEKQNAEMMKLYQENKVNPFGGCLPMLLQMPVWIALYQTLLTSFELYREPLVAFWISDLTAADPVYVLPLAMGLTMFITQKMQPQMGDPTQAKVMLYFMPIFFTFIMLNLPAGLTLYIFTNNLLSIAQQKYLQRKMAARA